MKGLMTRAFIGRCVAILLFSVGIYILTYINAISAFTSEFWLRNNYKQCKWMKNSPWQRDMSKSFPRHIHQIFFGFNDNGFFNRTSTARGSWQQMNPSYGYTLWDYPMVEKLISTKNPELLPLFRSYEHWVRKADMARYMILYHYGGLYSDLDIGCVTNIAPLVAHLNQSEFIMYRSDDGFISGDFFIAKPQSDFLCHVISGLEKSNHHYGLPYLTTMLSTGPLFLTGRFLNYKHSDELYIAEAQEMEKFIRHLEGSTWHQIDGYIIWWTYTHTYVFKFVFICTIAVVLLYCFTKCLKNYLK